MGIDTKGITSKKIDLWEVAKHIEKKYKNVSLHAGYMPDVWSFDFKDGEDYRTLFTCNDSDGEGTWMSLGMWGNSVEIMEYIVSRYGGKVDANDCDDVDYYNVECKF